MLIFGTTTLVPQSPEGSGGGGGSLTWLPFPGKLGLVSVWGRGYGWTSMGSHFWELWNKLGPIPDQGPNSGDPKKLSLKNGFEGSCLILRIGSGMRSARRQLAHPGTKIRPEIMPTVGKRLWVHFYRKFLTPRVQ